jgi:hypothetical protein
MDKLSKLPQSKAIRKSDRKSGKTVTYTKFMFQDVIYSVGEFLLFRETNKTQIVGQIVAILPSVQHKN